MVKFDVLIFVLLYIEFLQPIKQITLPLFVYKKTIFTFLSFKGGDKVDVNLATEIKIAQKQRGEALLPIIQKFLPLLKKYAFKLNYEDAFSDLQLFLISLIVKIDTEQFSTEGQLVSYIHISLKNEYIHISKKKNQEGKIILFAEFYEEDKKCDKTNDMMFKELKLYLSQSEYDVIFNHYYLGTSISQIAKEKRISRQAVNQIKNRALKKLRAIFEKE